MKKLTALFLASLTSIVLSSEPVPFTINTKKWSHVLDDHFISITVNPTDLLQGRVYGLQMNSTMAILKGLAPAYVRIGSADTAKYTFKRNRYPSDVVKPDDEYTVTETHWMVFNEVAQQAGLDVIVCLNAAHRSEGTKKWDTRNSLELISFSDSQGYNLTWQLGYEVQGGDDLSGSQFGKDLNRLRTILNAFPRYQHAKLIGPDIRIIHKKEDIDFWNDVLVEAGPTLDAVTWHPRWPQPSKMKVSDNSDLGYEFPIDYLEWDRVQLSKILQKSIFKNPVWIGETKRESTGTFAEGLIWARRLVLAAKLGVEVVMKQPNLMDITHPKPEYWIALLHKRLLGKSVLETRSVGNNTELTVISHCTNPFYWSDKPEKLQDGPVTVYGVNMGGLEQKIQIKGTPMVKSQLLFQYVLTSGSDPDSVFSQMTYLNGEPLMMTDDGLLPDIIPKIKKLEKGLMMKLPPYSVGFWVIPEAKVKICQIQQQNIPTINIETLTLSNAFKSPPKTLENIRDINQFIVDKLKNPESESEEVPQVKIEAMSSESSEKDVSMPSKENNLPRVARKIRQVNGIDELNQQIKTIMQETQEFLTMPDETKNLNLKTKFSKTSRTMEQRIQGLAEGISDAIKSTNQEQEFNKFLEDSGLKQDFGRLIINDRRINAPGMKNFQPYFHSRNPDGRLDEFEVKERLRRSITESKEFSQEENIEDEEELKTREPKIFDKKISLVLNDDDELKNQKQDLFVPHHPDIKGLEERYKSIVQSKLQDGRRKIDDLKRKIKQDETETAKKPKPTETMNDIQEEIIRKEIEILGKTEETVADILKNQKKRQKTFEDRIFDELNDVKGERIRELKEMHKNQRKKDNTIVKRQIQTPLSKPFLKTVEYIEKNFNLEPKSVRKIKRSLEERMGEILRNYDTKKNLEVKKRTTPLKEERKPLQKKSVKESDKKTDDPETDQEKQILTKERPKEKNIKKTSNSQSHHKALKKSDEETTSRGKKSEEIKKAHENDNDSFELFNEKKLPEPVKKSERRRAAEISQEKKTSRKISSKTAQKEINPLENQEEEKDLKKTEEVTKEKKPNKSQEIEEKPKTEPSTGHAPLKNDKERREHMLKQITLMVDKINSKEREGDGYKKLNGDEDISEEFESDRRPRGVRRRPRKAEMTEELTETEEGKNLKKGSEDFITVSPVVPTTATTKLSKHRKLRIRPNRKSKESKKVINEEGEKSPQMKRHLTGFERPFLELEKKKLIKPKLRKLSPKFHHLGNEFLTNEKPELLATPTQREETSTKSQEISKIVPEIETTMPTLSRQNEELRKDLEEIVEEKIFLEEGSETSREKSEISGKEFSKQEEMGANISEETPAPTEGYIIVEPTEEIESDETVPTEKTRTVLDDTIKEEKEKIQKVKSNAETFEEELENKRDHVLMTNPEKENENPSKNVSLFKEDERQEAMQVLETEKTTSLEAMDDSSSSTLAEGVESKDEESAEEMISLRGMTNGQRKRRATFLPNHHDEDDEDDYSSEERIQKFKQMIYRKSPTKKPLKNEVRSTTGMGMGADEFLRMAGSTVRVMFDDVIPEAYGQTKNKIQNMGIPEYIKEFGKIVQQMKNLDQIFLNIGEAAVKGYIKGNKEEKGPYIQVISRKKRGIKKEDELTFDSESNISSELGMTRDVTSQTHRAVDSKLAKVSEADETTDGSTEYATTSTGKASPANGQRSNWENARDVSPPGREFGKGIHEDDKTRSMETGESTENAQKEKMEAATILREKEKEIKSETLPSDDVQNEELSAHSEFILRNFNKTVAKKKKSRSDPQNTIKENDVGKKKGTYPSDDLQEKIFTPWIKTTKDFIQQALTTLQRQRELSEILAKDLMNGDLTKRAIEKREVVDEETKLPVYHMVSPSANKKRETQSDESLIRQLRGLQPGVYVVPTEEMTNIRSEQITNEAKQKSGMPNVVTLNIYYDKKNAHVSGKADLAGQTEPKISQDAVTYYQNKAWNAAASQYDQNNQYLTVPDMNLPTPMVSSVQVNPALQTQAVFAAEPRIAELPNSRLIQYPSPTYHYPPVQKMYPAIVPNPQPVYGPVYYLPQENRYASQPPGTKRQWREFKARSSGVPLTSGINSGWNIQYDVPASVGGSSKSVIPSSYNKNYKFLIQDKKRSVGDFKIDPTWSETALPFWKFFATSEKNKNVEPEFKQKQKVLDAESDSSEDVFEENRKRAKAAVQKVKINSIEEVTEEKIPEEEIEEVTIVAEEEKEEEEGKENSRKRRSINEIDNLMAETKAHKLSKRSYPTYNIEFRDHDVLPEWFGTYQEIENSLDNFPPHVRRSHIISTPWSEEDEELLNILEAENESSLMNFDSDDYYYLNDNTIQNPRRYPRSTDQFDSNMIKSNMIYKMPIDGDHLKPKILGMAGVKKLTDEDSSLEMVTKSKSVEIKSTTLNEFKKQDEHINQQQQYEKQKKLQQSSVTVIQPTTTTATAEASAITQPSFIRSLPSFNETNVLLRNPHDDTFYYFFKYAYDSLVKVMKSMTDLF